MRQIAALCLLMASAFPTHSQHASVDEFDQKYINWYNKHPDNDHVLGTSVDLTYQKLIDGNDATKTVIVAIIDSGVDVDHPDLEGRIWVNEDEIAGNNIDDDDNGYVDDVYGWNFIGNGDGRNVQYETFEYTRVIRSYEAEKKFNSPGYIQAKSLYDAELKRRTLEKEMIQRFEEALFTAKMIILQKTNVDVKSLKDVSSLESKDPQVMAAKRFLMGRYLAGFTEEDLKKLKESNSDFIDKFLNLEFDPRKIVGDNPNDIDDLGYGNPDVTGPKADHGTSVAGVIAAIRDNGFGINGIASDVKIMAIRSTPRGDERDKDVALAIRYAVDNGADIINMSFGKAISPQKQFVDDAVKYAEEHDVLLIHASGNDGQNIDVDESFPSDRFLDGSESSNWLNVGASGMLADMELPAIFSNYGQKHVDLFAPGQDIISLYTNETYEINDGTSLAAPIVSGIAALILSHYPELKPQQMIEILLSSTHNVGKVKVYTPNTTDPKRKKTKFKKLSKSGGVVNAYNAFQLAAGYYESL